MIMAFAKMLLSFAAIAKHFCFRLAVNVIAVTFSSNHGAFTYPFNIQQVLYKSKIVKSTLNHKVF
jgi:hypothetical protein